MPDPIEQRVKRLMEWFERRNDRPLLGFTVGSYYPLRRYPNGVRDIPAGTVRPEDIVVAGFLDDTDALYLLHEQAGGDLIWSATPFLGVPWLEAALGCGVVADHNSGSMRSTPPPDFASNPRVPVFSMSNPWVDKMLAFIPALEHRSAGRYPVGATLMRGISDLLSALYGGQEFILRMHDDPSEVSAVIDGLTEFWIAFGTCLLRHLPLFHGGTGCYMYSLWCPGKTVWLQEDAVALLSPHLFERFIFPADCRIAEAFEHVALHLHPTRYIPSDLFARSPVDVLELHIDHDGPRAAVLAPHHRTILNTKPLLIWGELTDEDLEFVMTELPAQGLAVNVVVGSVQEAHRLWARSDSILVRRHAPSDVTVR